MSQNSLKFISTTISVAVFLLSIICSIGLTPFTWAPSLASKRRFNVQGFYLSLAYPPIYFSKLSETLPLLYCAISDKFLLFQCVIMGHFRMDLLLHHGVALSGIISLGNDSSSTKSHASQCFAKTIACGRLVYYQDLTCLVFFFYNLDVFAKHVLLNFLQCTTSSTRARLRL